MRKASRERCSAGFRRRWVVPWARRRHRVQCALCRPVEGIPPPHFGGLTMKTPTAPGFRFAPPRGYNPSPLSGARHCRGLRGVAVPGFRWAASWAAFRRRRWGLGRLVCRPLIARWSGRAVGEAKRARSSEDFRRRWVVAWGGRLCRPLGGLVLGDYRRPGAYAPGYLLSPLAGLLDGR